MELLLLKLNELGIKTVFNTEFNTPTSCFRTQIAFSKNEGEWRIKPIFHKGHAASEHEIKEKLSEFLAKINKLKDITVGVNHENKTFALEGQKKCDTCPSCKAFCFSVSDNICLSCGYERSSEKERKKFNEGLLRGGYTTNGFVPMGDIYTPDQFPERHNL